MRNMTVTLFAKSTLISWRAREIKYVKGDKKIRVLF